MTSGGTRWSGVLVLAAALFAGCGGGSSGTGIPASTKVAALTDAQMKTLCDYVDSRQGGYGKMTTCADGAHTNFADQAECVDVFTGAGLGCPDLTAGDLEGCAAGPAGNVCTFDTAPECTNAANCFNAALQSALKRAR